MDSMSDRLTTTVARQKQEIKQIHTSAFVERSVSAALAETLAQDAVKVIVGPRRSGKSSLALQALKGRKFAYFNFEDESLTFEVAADDLLRAFEAVYPGHEYIFLDEVQLLSRWEPLVNRLHRLGHNLIITGSNSKLLSSELASSLTGRYVEFQLLPFSFAEYLRCKGVERSASVFEEYLVSGGFPTVVTGRTRADDFLPALWDGIILKDLVQRYKIRRISEIKALLYLVLLNMASRVSARSLSRSLHEQLPHSTINKFLGWAEGAYLCSMLQQFSFKARQRVNSEKKVYLYDTGFFAALSRLAGRNIGRLLEDAVFVELCRAGYRPNVSLFSYRTRSQLEVDFFVPAERGESALIQVAYSIADIETREREGRALTVAARELNVRNLFIVTCDPAEELVRHDGMEIRAIPAWQGTISDILKVAC
jgi:predicted AAA+ superfamily ATPase